MQDIIKVSYAEGELGKGYAVTLKLLGKEWRKISNIDNLEEAQNLRDYLVNAIYECDELLDEIIYPYRIEQLS